MSQRNLPTLRVRLLLLVMAFAAPMIGFEVWRAAQDRREAIAAAETGMLQLARVAAGLEDDSLQEASNLLRVLVRVQAIRSAGDGECHAFLKDIINEHLRIREITVVREDGRIECMAGQPVPPAITLADRPWFQAAMAADAPAIVTSQFLISRVSGQPTVVVAGAMTPDGQGAHRDRAVSIALDLGWLSELASKLPGPAGATALVMDARDGMVLARSADPASFVGRAFPDNPILAAFRDRAEGVLQHPGLDGVARLSGFTRLSGALESAMMVAVSIPVDAVVAPLNHHLLEALGAIGGVMLFGLALAALMADRLLIRPLEKLNGMALEMGRGDLSIRLEPATLDVREFSLLGQTLNRAAAQIEERDKRLAELAMRDGLTGLLNRRSFDERIAMEWQRAARSGAALAVAMIDIDRFKLVNDIYGHAIGDERLRRVACTLQGSLRGPSDLSARYGGEEFVVVLTDTGLDNAMRVAERLVHTIAELGLPNAGSEHSVVTVSIGVAATDTHPAASPADLIAAADAALYRAKALGRNRAVAAVSDHDSLSGPDLGGQPVLPRRQWANIPDGVGA